MLKYYRWVIQNEILSPYFIPHGHTGGIRVAIVEDEQEIRELLEQIIDLSAGIQLQRTFSSCEDALPG